MKNAVHARLVRLETHRAHRLDRDGEVQAEAEAFLRKFDDMIVRMEGREPTTAMSRMEHLARPQVSHDDICRWLIIILQDR